MKCECNNAYRRFPRGLNEATEWMCFRYVPLMTSSHVLSDRTPTGRDSHPHVGEFCWTSVEFLLAHFPSLLSISVGSYLKGTSEDSLFILSSLRSYLLLYQWLCYRSILIVSVSEVSGLVSVLCFLTVSYGGPFYFIYFLCCYLWYFTVSSIRKISFPRIKPTKVYFPPEALGHF